MAGAPRGRGLFAAGVVIAVVLLAGGVAAGVRGYLDDGGPTTPVRGYFAALAAGNAPKALGYGTVPAGPHTLLTSTVLRAQLHTAPLRDITITDVQQTGDTARVGVRYQLAFAGSPQQITSTLPVRRDGNRWQLTAVAVAIQLRLDTARDRIVAIGAPPPNGMSLVFPGATPVSFDSALLALDPSRDHVEFGDPSATDVGVVVSSRGRELARAAVQSAFNSCLAGHGPRTCPQPTERYVPGSLRGRLVSGTPPLAVSVDDAAGVLQVSGHVTVDGSYQRLTFANRPMTGHGRVSVPIAAQAYAVSPLRIAWESS